METDDNIFQPQQGENTIHIPITFDYKGGRAQNTKAKVIVTIVLILLLLVGNIILWISNVGLLWKFIICFAAFYLVLLFYRIVILREVYISDIYEKLKANDYKLDVKDIWQIFDIDYNYPYICYFKNGKKGLFVKMERDAITGKPNSARFEHYEAISDAYNVAHNLNMDITHIDYMDSVGNDNRMDELYANLSFCENEDMRDAMLAIYSHLQNEMSMNYFSYDIYLFTTRDLAYNFYENVQEVCNTMLGGNFLTYRILNADEIGDVCKSLFNLHEFSVNDACTELLSNQTHKGIRPLRVFNLMTGEVIKEINKTVEEEKSIREEQERLAMEAEIQKKQKRPINTKQTVQKSEFEEVPQPMEEVPQNNNEEIKDIF